MNEITIVYWRDIPAQVIVGKGRRGVKRQLTERFEQAIDRAAMKSGAKDADAYLSDWRKVEVNPVAGEPEIILDEQTQRLEREYDSKQIMELIQNDGWKNPI
ncbi:MAG: virulence factor [Aestuariivita sp.]|nr:virulence factor [Aestuariivita sp.]